MDNRLQLKQKIYNRCMEILENNAETARVQMNEVQEDANEAELEHDVFDGSRSELLRKRDIYAEQLQKAVDEIHILKKVPIHEISDSVKFGTVVITDKQKIFIALGLGKVKLEEDTFVVISKDVPIYKAMEGLNKGDEFQVNNNTFVIKDLF